MSEITEDAVCTIAFYNLENLFDTKNDPNTLDDDYTPSGNLKWSYKRYKRKLKKLGYVISSLGKYTVGKPPELIGVAEVENKQVVSNLLKSKYLRDYPYDFVHYDSPDARGMDVALIYNKVDFEYLESASYPVILNSSNNNDKTRDILCVKGKLLGDELYVVVNHWPSRRAGIEKSEPKRIKAAQVARSIIDRIYAENDSPRIIVMGDFNDGPENKSVKDIMLDGRFFNPMRKLKSHGEGTVSHEHEWYLFDQIIFSKNFLDCHSRHLSFKHASVFNKHFLQEWRGRFKGNPFKTYSGRKYLGGASDHYPVYVQLSK